MKEQTGSAKGERIVAAVRSQHLSTMFSTPIPERSQSQPVTLTTRTEREASAVESVTTR